MDLSIRKADVHVAPQDVPQDLSIKKPSSGVADSVVNFCWPGNDGRKAKMSALVAELEKPRTMRDPLENPRAIRDPLENPRAIRDPLENPRSVAGHLEKSRTLRDQLEKARMLKGQLEHPWTLGNHLEISRTLGDHLERPRTLGDHLERSRTLGDQLERSRTLGDHLERPRAIIEQLEKPRMLIDQQVKPRPLMTQRERVVPDLDQLIRTVMELQPRSLADQQLRSLAHQKAKTFADQKNKVSADLKPTALVIPKRSALVIPSVKSRSFVEQKTKTNVGLSTTAVADISQKSYPQQKSKHLDDVEAVHGLDLSKASPHGVQSAAFEQAVSEEQCQRGTSVAKACHQIWTPPLANGSCPGQQTKVDEETASVSQKRRRKQSCPQKRVKVDSSSHVPPDLHVDTAYLLSEEFLDKVTDAAQNGELKKGLDAYFGDVGQGQDNENNISSGNNSSGDDDDFNHINNNNRRKNVPDFARTTSQLTELDGYDGTDNDSVSRPASTDAIRSPLTSTRSSSLSPGKHQTKLSRVATTLQNREKRKALRLYGKEYTTPSGKTYPQRQVRDKDCARCRYNCSTSITTQQRQQIFEHFWSLDSYVKRLYYYCQSIKEKPAKTMKHTRECSREYTFLVEGERVRVCKGFYLATLDVSDKAVRIAMEKRKRGKGMWDKRGAHPPHNKTRPEDKDRVRSHIESFLIRDIYDKTCDSSPNSIPGQDLNVTKMHQDYADDCKDEGREPVSEDVYRKTFNTEYNLSTVLV